MIITTTKTRLAALALAAFATTAIAGPAAASGGNPGVSAQGSCSASSDWKLQAKPRDGRLEVEFEVDSNVNGQRWQVQLSDNGVTFFQGSRTTAGPSGSFEVHSRTANRAGADQIMARATNSRTGETCTGQVILP